MNLLTTTWIRNILWKLTTRKTFISFRLLIFSFLFLSTGLKAQSTNLYLLDNTYIQRFLDLYNKVYDENNGYFSADGVPYHSKESLICEAPDYGHETTSEAYSYWIWIDAMYGGITGDWSALNNSWSKMEQYAIPTDELQPTADGYNPSSPATFAAEHALPSDYPTPLETGVPVGEDPMSPDLTATYGANIYGMHWLFDCDNFYGYGNMGDGVSTPSYINTFQRGEQESVWETVPHPSWEDFSWGSDDGTGFLTLFIKEQNAPSAQWRYTNAPDADARVVQAMYWATQFAKEQELDPSSVLPLSKASKMGDFLRLAMCDKYFKPLGVQDKNAAGGTGYESVHYLLSWYYAWGGPLQPQGWAWRIGCSHNHFGYQNPVAAYALSEVPELQPVSANGVRDWGVSLDRQLEFYTWLQSAEGAIAGGATNSYNGDYSAYPEGTATFYEMAYDDHPVYHDPGSNQWFGMQAWSMERVAELYYITNDSRTKNLLDKWVAWVRSEVHLFDNGGYEIPSTLQWSGAPETWNPVNPQENTNLHVTVSDYTQDVGITACLAKALIYYAAGTREYEALDSVAQQLAKELLDRMWTLYYETDGPGVAALETRSDFTRFFEQEVYIPEGWTGKMANGDVIEPGITFLDIRSDYLNDSDFPALEAAYNAGQDYETKYHRFWAQADIMLANVEFGRLFPENSGGDTIHVEGVTVDPTTVSIEKGETAQITATVTPSDATDKGISWSTSNSDVATVSSSGIVTGVSVGTATITATTNDGGYTASAQVTVTESTTNYYTVTTSVVGNGSISISPSGGSYAEGTEITLTAIAEDGYQFDNWSGDVSGSDNPLVVTVTSNLNIIANFSEEPVTYTLTVNVSGNGSVDPAGGSYAEGTEVTLTAVPDDGYQFDNWSGDVSDTSATIIILMDSDKTVTANFSLTGGGCDTETEISMPFSFDGAGEYCWVTSGILNYLNSWNMDYLEVNGEDFTNKWSNNIPTADDGKIHIHYIASLDWAHFEITSFKDAEAATNVTINKIDNKVRLFPNPFNESIFIQIEKPEQVNSVVVYNQLGKKVESIEKDELRTMIEFGSQLDQGIYIVKVNTINGVQSHIIEKQ